MSATPLPLTDYIVQLPDALPAEFCEALLAEYRDSDEWRAGLIGSQGVQRMVRDVDTIMLSDRALIERNPRVRRRLESQLQQQAAKMLRAYHERFPYCKVVRDYGFELLRYRPGGFYRQHTDSFHKAPRELACTFLVNDGFEGGEFAFFDRGRVYTLARGDALVFPANFMYPHEVLPVTQGVRYAIVCWFI